MAIHRSAFLIVLSFLALFLGGCYSPTSRTADVAHVQIPGGEVAPGVPTLLIVPVLGGYRSRGGCGGSSDGALSVVETTHEEREILAGRFGVPRGAAVEVGSPITLAASGTGEELAARARGRGVRWMLLVSADTHPTGMSMLVLPSLLLLGLPPFGVSCEGDAQAALIDLSSGARLQEWRLEDSGWQIANLWTMAAAHKQIGSRANHRMMRRIGKEAAERMAMADAGFKESVAMARVRMDGWGE